MAIAQTRTFKDAMRIEGATVDCDKCRNKKEGYFCQLCHYDPMNLVDVEPFTAEELRIFLEAMAREETACKKADRQGNNESLVNVCKEIERKVKRALWTI